jgi:probable HAF family extracellular repeat protein
LENKPTSPKDSNMKTPSCSSILVTTLLALAIPLFGAAAQKHHHYKVIDIDTFGGPQSYFNSLPLTDVFLFNTVFYNVAQVRNPKGVLVGFADTARPDPNSANPVFCYVPDCFVTHAYRWQNGVETDLGVLPGGASSAAFWITPNGLIGGNSQVGETDPLIPGLPELRAVIWKDGHIHDLGTLGGSSSFSQAVNNRGQVTGLALNGIPDPFSFYYQYLYCLPFLICPPGATQTRAFVWDAEGGMQDIGTLGGPDAAAFIINQHGQVAGFSYTDSTPQPTTGFPTLHPFLWESGKGMKDLGSLGGTNTLAANGLNERGEVVGGTNLPGDQIGHPFLWDGKKLIDLMTPPFAASLGGEARWINEAGEVVGGAQLAIPCDNNLPFQGHGFLWRNGAMTDLGMIPGAPNSQAEFINAKSQVVGGAFSCQFDSLLAFLWEGGSIVDLNSLIPANASLYLYWAPFIDDQREIGAYGVLPNGDSHAVLLIPCDEGHPDVDGCDYSMVEADPAAQRPVAANRSHQIPEALLQKLKHAAARYQATVNRR